MTRSDREQPDHDVLVPNNVVVVDPAKLRNIPDVPRLARLALSIIARIEWGSILAILPDGRALRFPGRTPGREGIIKINDFNFAKRLLMGGTIGFAKAYLDRQWESPNVAQLLEVVAQNGLRMQELYQGNPIVRAIQRLTHAIHRNTRRGAKRNIVFHYDLGNAFYEEWLDSTMTYSSARFASPQQSLSEAQVNKYRLLAKRIDLRPGQSILEIGSGWGGFAEFAAGEIGAHVTGITISQEQFAFAKERIEKAGLQDRVKFSLQDYRDVEGTFDRIASIEMFEAVGLHYWPAFFRKIHDCLKPGGLAGLQVITIDDAYFNSYRRRADFIQRFVFPGGMLPSPSELRRQIENAGLVWHQNFNFGLDYAKTLKHWRDRFQEAWPKISSMGFDERFHLLWKFYLSYCEAGFKSGTIDVTQVSIART